MPTPKSNGKHPSKHWRLPYLTTTILLLTILVSCQAATPPPVIATPIIPPREAIESQPIAGGPVLLRSGISLRSLANVDGGSIKLELHPQTGDLYIHNPGTGLRRLKMDQSQRIEKVANPADIVEGATLSGMAFEPTEPSGKSPLSRTG